MQKSLFPLQTDTRINDKRYCTKTSIRFSISASGNQPRKKFATTQLNGGVGTIGICTKFTRNSRNYSSCSIRTQLITRKSRKQWTAVMNHQQYMPTQTQLECESGTNDWAKCLRWQGRELSKVSLYLDHLQRSQPLVESLLFLISSWPSESVKSKCCFEETYDCNGLRA